MSIYGPARDGYTIPTASDAPTPEKVRQARANARNLGALIRSGDVTLARRDGSYRYQLNEASQRIYAVALAIEYAGGCPAGTIHAATYGHCRWDEYEGATATGPTYREMVADAYDAGFGS